MPLRPKQSLFVRLIGELIVWVYSHDGWELTFSDGNIDPSRRIRLRDGKVVWGRDILHLEDGLHYCRLAQDFNLFVGDELIKGSHPAWDEIGAHWKTKHELCAWGGDFANHDYGHFSLRHEGIA